VSPESGTRTPEPGTLEAWQAQQEALEAKALPTKAKPPPEAPGTSGNTVETLWPVLRPEALHGLAGQVTRLISPHTEADDAAILFQTLAAFGVAVGRTPHYLVESDRHHANLFVAIVGNTAKGRKGTSWGRVKRLMETADPTLSERLESGLSSGEGLMWAVRDGSEDHDAAQDKRLLVVEAELSSPLKVMAREGNTLSATVRNAWDTGTLRSLTKNSPAKATNAHVGIIGHITKTELLRHLDATEFANGFANRFLYICVRRSKVLPFGGNLDDEALTGLGRELSRVLSTVKSYERVTMSAETREVWAAVYSDLSDAKPGLFGALIARSEAQVLRLALLYALLDTSRTIEPPHLEAALACWDYCEASARYLFGESLGDAVADTILGALANSQSGMTRTEISGLFKNHAKASQIDRALTALKDANLAAPTIRGTGGRPSEVWHVRG
jgi:hypothetical protein